MTTRPWYQMAPDEALEALHGSATGLSSAEVERRLDFYGPNLLRKEGGKGPWLILLRQFTDVMILILLVRSEERRVGKECRL